MARRLTLPAGLARHWRSLAAKHDVDPQVLLEFYLGLVVAEPERFLTSPEWRLGLLRTDDGPASPAGIGRVLGAHPRWQVVVTGEGKGVSDDGIDLDDAAGPAEEPGCQPCVLRRDDAVIVELALIPGRQLRVMAVSDERCEDALLDLACHEIWADLGSRAWCRLIDTADRLADALQAGGEDGAPDETRA